MTSPPTSGRFTFGQRVVLAVAPRLVKLLLSLMGFTYRYVTICEEGVAPYSMEERGVLAFWHQCTLACTYYPYFRRCHATILVSQSFDGELIARTLESFGFGTVRGSSSRGGSQGLLRLKSVVDAGRKAIFTADGPRGPIHQSKFGPIKLAALTGLPIGCFHLQPEHCWTVNSWDKFHIPKPFTRIVVSWGQLTVVPPDASPEQMETKRQELTASIESARYQARRWFQENPR